MVDVILKYLVRKDDGLNSYYPYAKVIGIIKAGIVLREEGGLFLTISNSELGAAIEKAIQDFASKKEAEEEQRNG